MLKGFVNTFAARPMMPDDIKTLVLPSQLNFPVVPPITKPQKKSRSQRRKEKQAQLVQVPELIPGEDDMDLSFEENEFNEHVASEEVKPNLTRRYVPKFDAQTNYCTWTWIPYELDENGKEVFDFQFEHDKAWSAFQRENEKREQQQQKWWDQNPQW